MKTLRDNILMLFGLPTPDEAQAWKDKAEEMAAKHDALQRKMAERYESAWKVTKDGTKRYRKVATKVLVNAWITESERLRCNECGDDNLTRCTEPGEEGFFRCAGSCALHKFD